MSLHMRPSRSFVLLMLGLLFGASGCDKLDDPVVGILQPIDNCELPEFEAMTSDVHRVLLEDFTGHQCGNCPEAGYLADSLAKMHPGIVFPLAIHSGNFAATNEEFPTDWSCPEGDEFFNDLDFQANPLGRVNRQESENEYLGLDEWGGALEIELAKAATAGLQLEVSFDPGSQTACIHVHTTWFQNVEGAVRLSLLVAENSLTGPQLLYLEGGEETTIEDFEFEHVLRGSVTGSKGLVVAENPRNGDTHRNDYALTWVPQWQEAHCDIYAILTESDGSVLQLAAAPVLE